jgi:hypothetical protein
MGPDAVVVVVAVLTFIGALLLISGLVVAGILDGLGVLAPFPVGVSADRPAGPFTDARCGLLLVWIGLGLLPGSVLASGVVADQRRISQGRGNAGTTGQQARSHKAGRRGDAHTRTHLVTTLQGVTTHRFAVELTLLATGHAEATDDPDDSVGLHHHCFACIVNEMIGRPPG